MKLDGFAVQYFLSQGFEDVASVSISRYALVDYPILYDDTVDMSGHVVLVPDHEHPTRDLHAKNALFVCTGSASAMAARDAGFSVIWVRGDVTFRQLYNSMLDVFVRNERLDAQLSAYVKSLAGFQALLDACSKAMDCKCALIDSQYRIVCQADPGASENMENGESDLLEAEVIDLFMASHRYRQRRKSRNAFTIPGSTDLLMKNIFSGDDLVGTLVMNHDGTSLSANFTLFLLNYLSPFIEEMYAHLGSFDQPSSGSSRVRITLSGALAGDAASAANLAAALIADGHSKYTNYVVLLIDRSFTHESDAELDYLARRFELSLPHTYCFVEKGNLYMLADVGTEEADRRRAFLQSLPVAARDNLAKIGVSKPFANMMQLALACEQANIALSQGSAINPTYWYYRFGDYALSWLIDRATAGVSPGVVRHSALTTLEAYDASHNTELAHTLKTFMNCRYNATAASAELFVARSTLLNRLERIKELTHIDLDDPHERLYLAISFELGA
ncbi:MAG: helix-turn-helix domain-containing protein [Eggerthellaceae bacterium]|nr:helix-turn-helix domain-containing protein [Eggerthellaceae bacterium]